MGVACAPAHHGGVSQPTLSSQTVIGPVGTPHDLGGGLTKVDAVGPAVRTSLVAALSLILDREARGGRRGLQTGRRAPGLGFEARARARRRSQFDTVSVSARSSSISTAP
jgi:hypothetical protein